MSSSINCPGTCSASFAPGSTVNLTATPAEGSVFVGWTGDVTSTDNPVAVVMDGPKTINAEFEPDLLTGVVPLGWTVIVKASPNFDLDGTPFNTLDHNNEIYPEACTLKTMAVTLRLFASPAGPPLTGGQTLTFTLVKGGVDTPLTVTFTSATPAPYVLIATDDVGITTTDLLRMRMDANGEVPDGIFYNMQIWFSYQEV